MKKSLWFTGLVIMMAACGGHNDVVSTNPPPPPPPPPPPTGVHIAIVDFAFQSDTVTAKVGELISWTNTATDIHTVTSDSAVFDSGPLQAQTSFTVSFAKAGTYTYHCALHPTMTGSITVTP
ncbi:MAG TPA: cupredoxin domain-containing protein [Gemmatimonadales bacterium]|jgi:plastocyanin